MAAGTSGGVDLVPPPRSRRKNEHSVATVTLCRTMYGDGEAWTPTQIHRYLASHMGQDAPSVDAIREWVIPGVAEHRRRRQNARTVSRASGVVARPRTATPVLNRMRQLAEAGVTFVDIAIVVRLDLAVAMTPEQVRYYLRHGKEPKHPKRKQRTAREA